MTTFVLFAPSSTANFNFQATLGGITCNVVCTWNLFGERYYISIYDDRGELVVYLPLIASPDNNNIDLVGGYFDTTLIYRESTNQFEIGS